MPLTEFYMMIAVTVIFALGIVGGFTVLMILNGKKANVLHSCAAVVKEKLCNDADEYIVTFLCNSQEMIFEVPESIYDKCIPGQRGVLDYKKYELIDFVPEKQKVPISLIVDDPAPRVSVYYEHAREKFTKDGRPLVQEVPNSLLAQFCRVVDTYGLKGKFTVVPMPGGRGYISQGIEGFDYEEIREWLDIARARLQGKFSFCPEMLTHARAMNLVTGEFYDENEKEWSKNQNFDTLMPYIARSLAVLKDVSLPVSGVSSPWGFGSEVEDEYIPAISHAMYVINRSNKAWVFYKMFTDGVNSHPWLAYDKDGFKVVSIPASIGDGFWETKDTAESSDEYISQVADRYISEDGTSGAIVDILEKGGYPIMLTHWQSLHSNGLNTGLRALELVVDRVNRFLSDRVEWMSFEEMMDMVIENPQKFPKPIF